jgi:hypothetical protein
LEKHIDKKKKTKNNAKQKTHIIEEEKGMKNSYFYGVLSFGRELKKRKNKNKINEKGLLKKNMKKRRKIMKDNILCDEKRR